MTPKPQKPALKVAIIGYTPHKLQAPWAAEHEDWELWMLNDLYMQLQGIPQPHPRRVRWFALHPWNEKGPDGKPAMYSADRAHSQVLNALTEQGGRVYLQEQRPEIPNAVRYPYEKVYEYFQDCLGGRLKYFTNTISFEIALAIMEGATEIGIYGVDMMTGGGGVVNNEYGFQRPSCEYWIQAAEARGIKVHIPNESDLLKSAFVYGDYAGNVFRTKLEFELKNAQAGVEQINRQHAAAEAQRNQLIGRAATIEWLINTWMPGDNGSLEARAPLPNAHQIKPAVPAMAELPFVQPPSDGGTPVNRIKDVVDA